MNNDNNKPFGRVIEKQAKHIVTMINFNWECCDCKYENTASLSEEEDLCQTDLVILTCKQCRYNNRILVADIYNFGKDY